MTCSSLFWFVSLSLLFCFVFLFIISLVRLKRFMQSCFFVDATHRVETLLLLSEFAIHDCFLFLVACLFVVVSLSCLSGPHKPLSAIMFPCRGKTKSLSPTDGCFGGIACRTHRCYVANMHGPVGSRSARINVHLDSLDSRCQGQGKS
jgi:hypothetical protein